ncbi:MAG: hypothetical protein AABY18_03380 [Candidatus Thermoplasmatota archaeon]|mgnify:CR=1 FL=1
MDEPAPSDDAGRELAARRRDLEHEFQDKFRDLKAQHKRQQESLQQDRVDWEEHRRGQQRELADRAEKVRRSEDNHKRDLDALRAARAELDATKAELAEQRVTRGEVKSALTVKSESDERLRAARGLLAASSFLAIAGFAGCALLLALGEARVALGVIVVGLLAAIAVEWRRRSR